MSTIGEQFEAIDSEEIFEQICQPCSKGDETLPAVGMCVDCQEYLCDMCFLQHRRHRPFKNHVLQDIRTLLGTSDQCPDHKGETVKYYCRSDNRFCCKTCIVQNHGSCDSVIFFEEEYKAIGQKLSDLNDNADIHIKKATTHMGDIETNLSTQTSSIKQFMTEIHEFFAKLEQDMLDDTKELKEKEQAKANTISDRCSAIKAEIQSLTSDLEDVHKKKQTIKTFDAMQAVKLRIKELEGVLTTLEHDNKTIRYEFEQGMQIRNMMGNTNTLGEMAVRANEDKSIDHPDGRLRTQDSEEIRERRATHVADIKVKSPTDSLFRSCMITGSVLLSGGHLVITDCNNWKVKVIDTKKKEIIAELSLSSWPFDITDINKTLVAVTVPVNKKVQFLYMSDDSACLTKGEEIDVNGTCRCLVHNNETLIVTFVKPPKVDIIDFNGAVLKTLSTDPDGQPLFRRPKYIALSSAKRSIYVCDTYNHSVIGLSLDGTVNTVYRHSTLKGPRGVAVDEVDGTLFVCCIRSHTIHLIGDYIDEGQILVKTEQGVSYPYSISYCPREHKIYVTMYDNNIKVYQIGYL